MKFKLSFFNKWLVLEFAKRTFDELFTSFLLLYKKNLFFGLFLSFEFVLFVGYNLLLLTLAFTLLLF